MSLVILAGGLELETSVDKMTSLPLQAFAITLSDDMLEDLIDSFQNGQEIELSLGQSPAFLYGGNTAPVTRIPENFSYDLYVTDPSSPETASLAPNPTMPLFKKQHLNYVKKPKYMPKGFVDEEDTPELGALEIIENPEKSQTSSQSKSSSLQPQSALNKKPKPATTGKKTAASNAITMSTQARSRPTSPAISAVGSPLPESSIESSHQQIVKEAKELRAPLIHALAVREMTYEELWEKWGKGDDDESRREFRNILNKVAEQVKNSNKYMMKKNHWKELDVWKHNYDSDSDRQTAIDNAVRHFDKMRIGASEPEWQKLLPFDDRGKGKCLSKLQASLARGPKGLTVHVQNADDTSGAGSPDTDNRSISGSQPMSRSSSQNKPKKAVEKKPAVSAPKKPAAPKISPSKAAAKPAAKTGARGPLSKEIITDSDESSDEIPLSQTKNVVKKPAAPTVRAPKPPVSAPVSGPSSLPKKPPPPAAREPAKPQITAKPPVKRPREEEDSSSSSGTPLAKKFKVKEPVRAPKEPIRAPKEPIRAPKETTVRAPKEVIRAPRETKPIKETKAAPLPVSKPRPADLSQSTSRTGSSNISFNRSKNTSPAKSSPLASSPPTNASDIDPAEEAMIANANRKRKADTYYNDSSSTTSSSSSNVQTSSKNSIKKRTHDDDVSASRRGAGSKLSPDVVAKARRFKEAYSDYERLHYELSGMNNPEESKLNELMNMHRRLEKMKKEIYSTTGAAYNGDRDRDRAHKSGEQKRSSTVASSRRERDEYSDYGRH
ncbi:hypothetical protein PspLS_04411 [Pyricularia sp. CBS 133598]|nr:hypothetical protein PspLS_04411 [Pyricularia sp. CBS 133598]